MITQMFIVCNQNQHDTSITLTVANQPDVPAEKSEDSWWVIPKNKTTQMTLPTGKTGYKEIPVTTEKPSIIEIFKHTDSFDSSYLPS